MVGQLAAIRLRDLTVLVNARVVKDKGLQALALPILAHEIGHHVYVPGNVTDNARLLAQIAPVLAGLPESVAPMVANLYADLLVNDRLQRRAGVDMAAVYRVLRVAEGSRVWTLYTRAYEHLWRLPAGSLAPDAVDEATDGDALLVARMVRAFAGDWLRGARRFAAVLFPYLAEDCERSGGATFEGQGLADTRGAGQGALPDGLAAPEAGELGDDGFEDDLGVVPGMGSAQPGAADKRGAGQARAPWTYADLMRRLGVSLPKAAITARFYRERALPHLLPFPSRRAPRTLEPLAEGYEIWAPGEDLAALDLFGTLLRSPVPVPGVTTVQRVYGETPGAEPARRPLDLDLYIDCSGSMPDPSLQLSYLALAGVILVLSALRVGGRVQATLWSSPGMTRRTAGFSSDEQAVLEVVCGYVSGGTSFPLPLLRKTWEDRPVDAPPCHLVVISDDGVDTMLLKDERGTAGEELARQALARARGGGTLVLNLPRGRRWPAWKRLEAIGWKIHAVSAWEELLTFARAFVRENYGDDG